MPPIILTSFIVIKWLSKCKESVWDEKGSYQEYTVCKVRKVITVQSI